MKFHSSFCEELIRFIWNFSEYQWKMSEIIGKSFANTHMKQWCFDNFTQFFDLFLASADIAVRYIWLVFNLHHCHSWIDFWWQRNMNLILITVDTEIFNDKNL